MYEEQTSWKLEDDPYMKVRDLERQLRICWVIMKIFVREHFAEECKEGLMEKVDAGAGDKRRFGDESGGLLA